MTCMSSVYCLYCLLLRPFSKDLNTDDVSNCFNKGHLFGKEDGCHCMPTNLEKIFVFLETAIFAKYKTQWGIVSFSGLSSFAVKMLYQDCVEAGHKPFPLPSHFPKTPKRDGFL